jgi:DNA-binding NarL/FixJ family response regulator
MDVRLASLDGLSAAERLRRSHPTCAVVILTLYDDFANRARAEQIGVAAFISKQEADVQLVTAIRNAISKKGEHK